MDLSTESESSVAVKVDKSLKEEILEAVEPFIRYNGRPQLSSGELAVMAVLCCDANPVTDKDVSNWIVRTFPYYMALAVNSFLDTPNGSHFDQLFGFTIDMSRHKDHLNLDYKVPLQETGMSDDRTLQVNPREGSFFLRRLLEPERKGTFRFLDLPAEIRVIIYEYTFSFHGSGLGFGIGRQNMKPFDVDRLHILRAARFDDDATSTSKWTEIRRNVSFWKTSEACDRLPPNEKILALLSVNKQIYGEAMPLFYRCNHFYVESIHQLAFLLVGCGAKRRQHFTSIGFTYSPTQKSKTIGTKTFRLLAQVKHLRFLQIDVEAVSANDMPPAVDLLGQVKADNVDFVGSSAKLEKHLKAAMMRPKAEEEAAAAAAKKDRELAKRKAAAAKAVATKREIARYRASVKASESTRGNEKGKAHGVWVGSRTMTTSHLGRRQGRLMTIATRIRTFHLSRRQGRFEFRDGQKLQGHYCA